MDCRRIFYFVGVVKRGGGVRSVILIRTGCEYGHMDIKLRNMTKIVEKIGCFWSNKHRNGHIQKNMFEMSEKDANFLNDYKIGRKKWT